MTSVTADFDEPGPHDTDRQEWLEQSERTLCAVWDNEADDVYTRLLRDEVRSETGGE